MVRRKKEKGLIQVNSFFFGYFFSFQNSNRLFFSHHHLAPSCGLSSTLPRLWISRGDRNITPLVYARSFRIWSSGDAAEAKSKKARKKKRKTRHFPNRRLRKQLLLLPKPLRLLAPSSKLLTLVLTCTVRSGLESGSGKASIVEEEEEATDGRNREHSFFFRFFHFR